LTLIREHPVCALEEHHASQSSTGRTARISRIAADPLWIHAWQSKRLQVSCFALNNVGGMGQKSLAILRESAKPAGSAFHSFLGIVTDFYPFLFLGGLMDFAMIPRDSCNFAEGTLVPKQSTLHTC
jgi:hypothetical protein